MLRDRRAVIWNHISRNQPTYPVHCPASPPEKEREHSSRALSLPTIGSAAVERRNAELEISGDLVLHADWEAFLTWMRGDGSSLGSRGWVLRPDILFSLFP